MKVLYVDTDSPSGHINFNRIYIQALQEKGIEVKLAVRAGYIRELGFPERMLAVSLPERMYIRGKAGRLVHRMFMLRRLLYLRRKISLSDYEYVFFSSYEEISFYFSGLKASHFILINHRNVLGLGSRLKSFFLKNISRRIGFHIVFAEYMKTFYQEKGIGNVKVVPHGLPFPYQKAQKEQMISEEMFSNWNMFRYVIFSPSSSSSDVNFLNSLVVDKEFCRFLSEKSILLVLKGNYEESGCRNVKILNQYLSPEQYQTLFLRSNLILICYPPSFDYCVSAVLFECMANNKPCIMTDIRALKVFDRFMDEGGFFANIDELKRCIVRFMSVSKENWYCSLPLLRPDFGFLFTCS